MHVQMRRVPAERARHAKRLGPIILSTASTTSTSTQATSTTSSASSTQPSSTALPTPTPTPSPSPVPTSATTSSTHSSATSSASTSTSPLPTTELPSSITSQLPTMTPTYSTSSSTPTPTPTPQSHASASSGGLSGGAIAGIIAGAVIIGVALVVFFVRKTYLRRRERKFVSWDQVPEAAVFDEPKFPDIGERSATPPSGGSPFEPHAQSMYPASVAPAVRMQPPTPSYAILSPPPPTYNNPTPVTAYPTPPAVPSTYGPGNTAAFAAARVGMPPAQHAQAEAIVKCTFVPTLPDELSITTGERIFIVEQYDDGWDLCANGRGERGMVPRECLERAPSDQPEFGWMNVGRMSSLNDGKRY